MRINFPFNLTVGTDIVRHHRFNKPKAPATYLQRIVNRFLHPNELHALNQRFSGWQTLNNLSPVQHHALVAHIAGRWAAKEAAKKAWGATLLSFKDLRVEAMEDGNVQIVCRSYREAKEVAGHGGEATGATYEQVARLSISHDGDYAVATVIASPLHPVIVAELQARKAFADKKVMPLT